MTATNTLHQLAMDAVTRTNLDDFPALKQELRKAVEQEQEAATKHQYSLKINMGGIDDATVYFNVEGGDTPDEWIVAEGLEVFYKGINVTDLFDGSDIDEKIYAQSNEVESMMADAWAEHMIDRYADIDD